jgi:predicted MPP superfamily phosphohydrolase
VARRVRPELEVGIAREEMSEFLAYVADRTGLLIDRGGGVLSFIHLSFQEYLAAWVYTCGGTPAPEFFEERMGQQAWEEVLLLRLYVILTTPGGGGPAAFDAIVNHLLRALDRRDRPQVWLTLCRALRDNLEFRKADQRAILERAVAEWLKQPAFSGDWFDVLLEITLFTEVVTKDLREIVLEAIARRPAAASMACLHLATRLFGFPAEAVKALESRNDLAGAQADLCAFWGSPAAAPLLAKASAADWTAMLEAVDSPQTYRRTTDWMASTGLPPAALDGATAFLWRKVVADFASRTAFAAKHLGRRDAGDLFTNGETLGIKGWKYTVELPYAVLCLPIRSPGLAPAHAARLLCPALAAEALGLASPTTASTFEPALMRWVTGILAEKLNAFPSEVAIAQAALDQLAGDFVRDFGRNFGRAVVRDFGRAGVRGFIRDFSGAVVREFVRDFGRAFGRGFERASGRAFGRGFVRAFVRSFGRASGRDFVRDFGRNFGRNFVRDFGVDADAPDFEAQWEHAMTIQENLLRALEDPRLWDGLVWYSRPDVGIHGSLGGSTAERLSPENPFALPLALVDLWTAAGTIWFSSLGRDFSVQYPAGNFNNSAVDAWLERNSLDAFSGALAWGRHAEILVEQGITLEGERGALVLAHAAYCACRAGFIGTSDAWKKLLGERDRHDPRIEAAHLLFQIASFENTDTAVTAWKKLVQSPPAELRPLFEAAGILAPQAAASASTPAPSPPPPKETLVMSAWFEVLPFPWSDPRASQLRDHLVAAYDDIRTIRAVGQSAGVGLGRWESDGGAEPAWESLLRLASSQGKVRVLLEKILQDKHVAAFHREIRELMKGDAASPPGAPARAPSATTAGAPAPATPPAPAPAAEPREQLLFSWIQLSDIHIGHGDRAYQLNQMRILEALAQDIDGVRERDECPMPGAVFVTGDIAFSGKTEQYTQAATWLKKVAAIVGLDAAQVFVVPGNHDVDRTADKDILTSLTVGAVRGGLKTLDDILHDDGSRALLARRMAAYCAFAADFGPAGEAGDRLFWTHTRVAESGTKVRLLGLDTALLAAGDDDKGKLALGEVQIQLLRSAKDELTIVLTHHPLHWLSDHAVAAAQMAQHADVHVSGHVHEAESMSQWGGGGTGILRVVAGAAHNERQPGGASQGHGYNWAAVVRTADQKVVLRVWPWKWVQAQDFRLDVVNVPRGKTFAEHALPRLRLPARRT